MRNKQFESSKLTVKERIVKLLGLEERPEVVHYSELSQLDIIKFVGIKFYFENVILPKFSNLFQIDEH